MKKNLFFALSVFLVTIAGLLVFCEASDKQQKKTENIEINSQKDDFQKLA